MRTACRVPRLSAVVVLVLSACAGDATKEDGSDDSFLGGKTDAAGIVEGSAIALAVLQVANQATAAELEADGRLTAPTASEIAAHRAGADGALDTADDDRFETLVELDAVPFVGPVAFAKLVEYATALGFLTFDWRTELRWAGWSADRPTVCTITAPADAAELRLMIDTAALIDVRDASGTTVQRIHGPFHGWTDPIPGTRATYQVLLGGTTYVNCKDFRGASAAVAYRVPVASEDPLACVTRGGWVTNPSTTWPDRVAIASASIPDPEPFEEIIGDPLPGDCAGGEEVALPFTPPTDGEYTFATFEGSAVAVRADGCGGTDLACGREVVLKLEGGRPVVIGLTARNSWTKVDITLPLAELDCTDGFDGDGDGAADCADADCAEACDVDEACDNGADDDGDGATDCGDADCGWNGSCGANECPGDDLGSATEPAFDNPVAYGNTTGMPTQTFFACPGAPVWTGSRFYAWTAPSAGSWDFRATDAPGSVAYDLALRVLDGTCDGDVLGCSTGAGTRLTLAAGQEIVIEVGASGLPSDPPARFQLMIYPTP
jgi:hypothetical protein